MYDKTITVFNKYVNQKDEIFWYPTIIKGVQLIVITTYWLLSGIVK